MNRMMQLSGATQVTKIIETKPIAVDSKLTWEIKNFPDIKDTTIESAKIDIPDIDAYWWVTILPRIFDGTELADRQKTVYIFNLKTRSELWKTERYEVEVICMTFDKSTSIGNRKKIFHFAPQLIDSEIVTVSDYMKTNSVHASCSKLQSYTLEVKVIVRFLGSSVLRSKTYDPYAANNDILSNVRSLYNDPWFSDFTFVVKGKEFKVHKNILAAASSVMRKLFTSDMEESRTNVCKLDQFEPEVFDRFLEYVYTGKCCEDFSAYAKEIYVVADYYQIDRLKKLCQGEIHDSLDASNAVESFTLADRYDLLELKYDAWEIVKR